MEYTVVAYFRTGSIPQHSHKYVSQQSWPILEASTSRLTDYLMTPSHLQIYHSPKVTKMKNGELVRNWLEEIMTHLNVLARYSCGWNKISDNLNRTSNNILTQFLLDTSCLVAITWGLAMTTLHNSKKKNINKILSALVKSQKVCGKTDE